MLNQLIIWSLLILPWLTVFLLKPEERMRYMPAALFTMVSSVLIFDAGVRWNWWVAGETIYPLNEILSILIGALPVSTIWFLKFFYGRFWLYSAIELVFSVGFAWLIQPWLNSRGIWIWIGATPLKAFLPTIPHFVAIYLYHMWQERIFTRQKE